MSSKESITDPKLARDSAAVGLPPRIFLYTLDQIAYCIGIRVENLKRSYVHFEGRSSRAVPLKGMLLARNIAPVNETPEWRVAETEFVRWMKHKGFRFIESYQVIR